MYTRHDKYKQELFTFTSFLMRCRALSLFAGLPCLKNQIFRAVSSFIYSLTLMMMNAV